MPVPVTSKTASTTKSASIKARSTKARSGTTVDAGVNGPDAKTTAREVEVLASKVAESLQISGAAPSRSRSEKSSSTTVKVTASTNGRTKATESAAPPPTRRPVAVVSPEEASQQAMRTVNSELQSLTSAVLVGWKRSQVADRARKSASANAKKDDQAQGENGSQHSAESITTSCASCRSGLATLRLLKGESGIDPLKVERAAVNVAGKLVSLEMWTLALDILSDSHAAVLGLYEHVPCPAAKGQSGSIRSRPGTLKGSVRTKAPVSGLVDVTSSLWLLHFPAPVDGDRTDGATLNVIASSQLYALNAIVHLTDASTLESLCRSLSTPGSFLDSIPTLQTRLGSKSLSTLVSSAFRCIATTLSSSDPHPPAALFGVRSWALKCFIWADEINGDDFWRQVTHWAAAYAKSAPEGDRDAQQARSRDVTALLMELVKMVESRVDKSTFNGGAAFGKLCDWWISLARKVDDFGTITFVSSLLSVPTPAGNDFTTSALLTQSKTPSRRRDKKEDAARALSNIYGRISHTQAILERFLTIGEDNEVVSHLKDITVDIAPTSSLYLSGIEGIHRLQREVSRLRRTCVQALDRRDFGDSPTEDIHITAKSVLEAIALAGERVLLTDEDDNAQLQLTADFLSDLTSGSVDALLTLARTTINPAQHITHNQTYAYLHRATVLGRRTPAEDCFNYLRCVSAAFHNVAATMYKDKAGFAVRFAEQGCALAKEALELMSMPSDSTPASQDRKALREQISKRYELLGHCYFKRGDRRLAYGAYCDGLSWLPPSLLEDLRALSSSRSIHTASETFQSLWTLVDRITKLGTTELLMSGSETSLRERLESGGVAPEVIGAILEYQVLSLDDTLHTSESLNAAGVILDDLLIVYSAAKFPIRRARVLLRKLEHQYYTTSPAGSSIGQEIFDALESQDMAADQDLITFIPQYRALAHLWLALHAHADQNTLSILEHSREAIKILRRSLVSQPSSPQKPAPSVGRTPGKGRQATKAPSKAKTPARTVSGKARKAPDVKTPLRATMPSQQTDKQIHALDNAERAYRHLELLSELLNLSGFAFERLDLLEIMRHTSGSHRVGTPSCDGVLIATAEMAYENARLGKTGRASHLYSQALSWSLHKYCSDPVSDEARVRFLLKYASSLAAQGQLEKSVSVYLEARAIADDLVLDAESPTSSRIRGHTLALERSAVAAMVYSVIQVQQDDLVGVIQSLEQSLRLWNRAFENIARMRPSTSQFPSSSRGGNPFLDDDNTITKKSDPKVHREKMIAAEGLQWRIAQGVFAVNFNLAEAYHKQGSPRAALFHLQRAVDLAEGLNAPLMLASAVARQGELRLLSADMAGAEDLDRASGLLDVWRCAELVDTLRVKGDYYLRRMDIDQAKSSYALAAVVLQELEESYRASLLSSNTPRKLTSARRNSKSAEEMTSRNMPLDVLLPVLQAALLRQQVWLTKEPSDNHEFEELLTRLLCLPPIADVKAEEYALLGHVHFNDACNQFKGDMFLSSLTESTIALPVGVTRGPAVLQSPSSESVISLLDQAEQNLWQALELMSPSGNVAQIRRTSVSLALIRAFQTTLGKLSKKGPRLAAALLEMSCATTLRRQMLESIELKCQNGVRRNDLTWPLKVSSIDSRSSGPTTHNADVDDDDASVVDDAVPARNDYWEATRRRYQALSTDFATEAPKQIDLLPEAWTVISINVSDDKSTMLVTRHRTRHEPLIFCLPLDRQGRREGEEDQFTFQYALAELEDIIEQSKEGIRVAKDVEANGGAARWCSERRSLDKRLGELLETMEFCWLGAFKTIMSEPTNATPDMLHALRARFDKIFRDCIGLSNDKGSVSWARLDDNILECFSTLSPKCRDEELEDFIYFVLDLYHFHGVPVALAEIDIDMVVTDIRIVLEEFASKLATEPCNASNVDQHLFLILDKNVQSIPWESMPVLRGRSVSRIPSISFLIDRLELVRHRRAQGNDDTSHVRGAERLDRVGIDPRKVFYMLNTSGDLKRTEQRFSGWFRGMDEAGWRGITGRKPMTGEMLNALESSELLIFIGHGGGEEYVRAHQLRGLRRCSAVMLWGCSSGALRDLGEFDRFGTPLNYMLAGCPNVVATLWDVTDHDIDRLSESVFKKLHLDRQSVGAWNPVEDAPEGGVSVVQAVAQARDACKLKYLNGAAPVIYGIPYYL